MLACTAQHPAAAGGYQVNRCPGGCVSPPPGCVIKGQMRCVWLHSSVGEKRYYLSGDRNYDRIILHAGRGDRWFCTEDEARSDRWERGLP